jgi:integrase
MGSVYKRGGIWWLAYVDETGKRQLRSAETRDERIARRRLEALESSSELMARTSARPTTVDQWVTQWAKGRKNWTADGEMGRLAKHVLPVLGHRRLIDVTTDDVRVLVASWSELAPRTIRNVFWVMSKVFSDAVAKKLIDTTPCVLLKGDRPKISDKDRRWRQTAVFTRLEAEQLLSSELVPADRHVLWALGFGAGLRLGEVSALRWRDYEADREGLGCLHISSSYTRINGEEKATKTETPRQVPVHPALAEVLTEWRRTGWQKQFGAAPVDSDLVLPNRVGRHLTDNNVHAGRMQDFRALALRPRRFHDARRTFISLAQAGGASSGVLKLVTHGSPGSVMDLYTTLPWSSLCQAVLCLKLERRGTRPAGLLHKPLQSTGDRVQLAQLLNNLKCPRRDSNPPNQASGGTLHELFQRGGGHDSEAAKQESDALCSTVATDQGRRAQVVLARYAKAGGQ